MQRRALVFSRQPLDEWDGTSEAGDYNTDFQSNQSLSCVELGAKLSTGLNRSMCSVAVFPASSSSFSAILFPKQCPQQPRGKVCWAEQAGRQDSAQAEGSVCRTALGLLLSGFQEAPATRAGSGDMTGVRVWGCTAGFQEGNRELEDKFHLQARAGEGSAKSQSCTSTAPVEQSISTSRQVQIHSQEAQAAFKQELVHPEQRLGKVVVSFGYPKGCISLLRVVTIALAMGSKLQGCEEAEHRPNYLQSHLYCKPSCFVQSDLHGVVFFQSSGNKDVLWFSSSRAIKILLLFCVKRNRRKCQ